jgi:hypothetical protein
MSCCETLYNPTSRVGSTLFLCQDLRIELSSRTNIIWAVSTADDFSYHGPDHRGNAGQWWQGAVGGTAGGLLLMQS